MWGGLHCSKSRFHPEKAVCAPFRLPSRFLPALPQHLPLAREAKPKKKQKIQVGFMLHAWSDCSVHQSDWGGAGRQSCVMVTERRAVSVLGIKCTVQLQGYVTESNTSMDRQSHMLLPALHCAWLHSSVTMRLDNCRHWNARGRQRASSQCC